MKERKNVTKLVVETEDLPLELYKFIFFIGFVVTSFILLTYIEETAQWGVINIGSVFSFFGFVSIACIGGLAFILFVLLLNSVFGAKYVEVEKK